MDAETRNEGFVLLADVLSIWRSQGNACGCWALACGRHRPVLARFHDVAQRPERVEITGVSPGQRASDLEVTRLRYPEVSTLRSSSFRLRDSPSVAAEAASAKARPTATWPLPQDLLANLAPFLADLPPEAAVFPLPEKGAARLRVDLAAAAIPYRDDPGRVFHFHSLRCQLATLADQAGVSPRGSSASCGTRRPT